jgi:hypothetical protein
MGLMIQMLLLDLDGVLVFEAEPPLVSATELVLLHETFALHIAALEMPVVVLTHRSRREANHILQAAGLTQALAGVIAAEDLFWAGIRHAPLRMLTKGLRKDLVLSAVEQKFGVQRSRIAFIDDRLDNLQDLVTAGLGLAIHAPSYQTTDQALLMTFDLGEACQLVRSWDRAEPQSQIVGLPPRQLALSLSHRTGLSTTAHRHHLFNVARRVASILRLSLSGRLP